MFARRLTPLYLIDKTGGNLTVSACFILYINNKITYLIDL